MYMHPDWPSIHIDREVLHACQSKRPLCMVQYIDHEIRNRSRSAAVSARDIKLWDYHLCVTDPSVL